MFKKIIAALFTGLIITTMLTTYGSASEAERLSGGVLRLHIIANSDSASDQRLKLMVRDAVIAGCGSLFTGADDKAEAAAAAQENLAAIETVAGQVLRGAGNDDEVHAEITRCFFPTKEYESGVRLPAGYYDALRLTIGEGKGHNWWCILYPPLCFGGSVEESEDELSQAAGEASSMAVSDTPKYQVRFKFAEWWGSIVEFFSGK